MGNEDLSKLGNVRADQFAEYIEGMSEANDVSKASAELGRRMSADRLEDEGAEYTASSALKKNKKLEPAEILKTEKARKAQESVLVRKEEAENLAEEFSQRQGNREYHLDRMALTILAAEELGAGIKEDSQIGDIISLLRKRMTVEGETPDVAIVDKAFEFLIEVTQTQMNNLAGESKIRLGKIYNRLVEAKQQHFDAHAIEIQVAQKIIGAVDAVVKTTGQTVKETLTRYRDVVHNPPELQTLRRYYETKGYKAMILELKGLNSYLGGNLKRKNLENSELSQLAIAARKMQALLGVYRQAKSHISTAESYLNRNHVFS